MKELNESDRALTDAFRTLAAEDASLAASSAVESRLRAEVRAIARRRRSRRAIVLSLAAAAVLAVAIAVLGRGAVVAPVGAPSLSGADAGIRDVATGFFPLDYSGMPVSNAQLVRLEVPRAALASFGLTPIDVTGGGVSATPGGTVQADVLVGEDGVARAVRFVSP